MTDHLYAKLRRPQQQKNHTIPVALGFCFVIFAAAVSLILYAMWYQCHYREFVGALSRSTVYAYRNDSLYLETGDSAHFISGSRVYLPYDTLTKQPGKLYRTAPDREPDIRLDYGDGAALLLWEVKLEEGAHREYGVFWQFTSPDGESWLYDSDMISMNTFSLLL